MNFSNISENVIRSWASCLDMALPRKRRRQSELILKLVEAKGKMGVNREAQHR
jgi:hypothetical protein